MNRHQKSSILKLTALAGLDALSPRVIKLRVARASAVVEPSSARSATAGFARLLECAALRTPVGRLGNGRRVGLDARAVATRIEGFHNCFSRMKKPWELFVPRGFACFIVSHLSSYTRGHELHPGAAERAFDVVEDGCGTPPLPSLSPSP